MFTEAYCQRFFVQGRQSSFFDMGKKPSGRKKDLLRAVLNEQLHAHELEQRVLSQTYSSSVAKTEVSPWLEMTRWPRSSMAWTWLKLPQ
jgi:hypothetical protein